MSCKTINDPVEGYAAAVDASGSLQVKVSSVDAPVETSPEQVAVVTTTLTSAATTSAQLVGPNPDRRQIDIQNLDAANAVHIRLSDASAATTGCLRIAPGERYSFPPGVCYTGHINAISAAGTPAVVVQEFVG